MDDLKNRIISAPNFVIRGQLLRWYDTAIQISNISMVSTADLPAPKFPVASLLGLLIGAIMAAQESYYSSDLSTVQVIGICVLVVSCSWIVLWIYLVVDNASKKCLHLFLNSGNVYSFVFKNEGFLKEVLQLLSNIIETGTTSNTNFHINLQGCEIRDHGSVIHMNATKY